MNTIKSIFTVFEIFDIIWPMVFRQGLIEFIFVILVDFFMMWR